MLCLLYLHLSSLRFCVSAFLRLVFVLAKKFRGVERVIWEKRMGMVAEEVAWRRRAGWKTVVLWIRMRRVGMNRMFVSAFFALDS